MFTLGIDRSVNAAFLRRLAGAGGGLCELVESEDRLDLVMDKVHRRIGTPIATELHVASRDLDLDRTWIAPTKLPDVYAGAPVTIFGRYRGRAPANATIDLEGTTLGEPMRVAVAAGPSTTDPARWLAASWARAAIRDREDQYAAGKHELAGEIVMLSKTHNVLSRFTAFLAVDRAEVVNRGGHLRQVVQPVEKPSGWDTDMGRGGMIAGGEGGPRSRSITAITRASAEAPAVMYQVQGARYEDEEMLGFDEMADMDLAPEEMPPASGFAPPLMAPAPPAPRAPAGPPPARASRAARPSPMLGRSAPRRMPDREQRESGDADLVTAAHLAQLGILARDLDEQGRGRLDLAVLRLLRQRLAEWAENVRSTDGSPKLAEAVEQLVQRLGAAIARGTEIAADVVAIAFELAKLADGSPPPAPSRPARQGFWK
jgi:Ca-activated chloride channel family protein